jgi:hypothetical protein
VPEPSSALQSVNPFCAGPGGELLKPSNAKLRGKWPRGKLLKTSSAEPKPSGAEPKPSNAEPSAEPQRSSSTELIGKLTGPTSAEPRPSSSELIIESTGAKLIAEHLPRPSIAEQSRPSGAELNVKLPRPSIAGPTVESSVEQSAELSSASLIVEQSRAEPSVIEPSGAELCTEPRRPH